MKRTVLLSIVVVAAFFLVTGCFQPTVDPGRTNGEGKPTNGGTTDPAKKNGEADHDKNGNGKKENGEKENGKKARKGSQD